MNRTVPVNSLQRIAILLVGLMAAVLWVLAMSSDQNYFFAAAGTSLLFVVVVPILALKEYDWFCPWTAVIVAVVYGCTFPSLCMSFGLPNEEFLRDEIFLGEPPTFFVMPSLMLLFSFSCVAIGYFGWPEKRLQMPTRLIHRVHQPSRLLVICLLCGAVTTAAFGAYFMMNGGFSGGLSTKRSGLRTLDVGADSGYRSHGYLRHLAKFGNIALLLLAAHWSRYRPRAGSLISVIQALILGILLMVSIAFPFYSSSRAGILWVVFGLAATLYYMQRKLFTAKSLGLVGLMLAVIVFVTAVRNGGSENSEKIVSRISHLFLNRHGPDVAVTSHIVHAIPHTLDYQYGKTISVWALAPVPREIMPSKPLMHTGPIIGQSIYKLGLTGIPTGLTAELYWNFHLPGVFFGSLLVGGYLRWLYHLVKSVHIDPVLLAPVYSFAIFPIGFKMSSVAVGPGLVMPLIDLATVCFIAWLASVSSRGWDSATELNPLPPVNGSLPTH